MELTWENVINEVLACRRCGLCQGRQNAVPGMGNQQAKILFVGEGPGAQEDAQGLPFVGPAGQLLDKMLAAIDLDRQHCYIANVVKCRPPRNRVPLPEEAQACLPFLRAQTALLRPKIIVALGSTAAKQILGEQIRITRDRGIWHERKGCFLIATYHPSYLLRDPAQKKDAWEDFKKIRDKIAELGLPTMKTDCESESPKQGKTL